MDVSVRCACNKWNRILTLNPEHDPTCRRCDRTLFAADDSTNFDAAPTYSRPAAVPKRPRVAKPKCPECGTFLLPKQTRCHKCDRVVAAPATPASEIALLDPDASEIPLADEPTGDTESPAAAHSECPNCNAALETDAVICVACGLDLRTGAKLGAAGPAPRVVSRDVRSPDITEVQITRRDSDLKIYAALTLTLLGVILLINTLNHWITLIPRGRPSGRGEVVALMVVAVLVALPLAALISAETRIRLFDGEDGGLRGLAEKRVLGVTYARRPIDMARFDWIRKTYRASEGGILGLLVVVVILIVAAIVFLIVFPPLLAITVALFLFKPVEHPDTITVLLEGKTIDTVLLCDNLTEVGAPLVVGPVRAITGLRVRGV